jgi:site-specific DNA recombinase
MTDSFDGLDSLGIPVPATATATAQAQRAAIYCRVSTSGQQENGSLEEQEARGRTWCAEHGYSILDQEHIYREVFSGEDIDRPRLDELRDEVRAGRVDVIVADKVDRFSRADPAITAYVMVEAEQYGTKVEFVEIQDDSFEGQILSAVLAIVARVEHKRIKERTVAGRRRRIVGDASKGKPPRLMPGSIPTYGWRYADATKSRYVVQPEQAAVMERAYRAVAQEGRSLNAFCVELEAEGVPPPLEALAREGYPLGKRARHASRQWNAPGLARMMRNPAYWGEAIAYRYEGYKHPVRDKETNRVRRVKRSRFRDTDSPAGQAAIVRYPPEVWPGIVAKELAMQALARLAQNKIEATRNSRHVDTSFLRAGLVVCGYCGANLRLRNYRQSADSEAVLRFGCGRHENFKLRRVGTDAETDDCPAHGQVHIRADMLEQAVWGILALMLADPDRVPAAYDALNAQEAAVRTQQAKRTKTLTTLITQAQQRRLRLVDMAAGEADGEMRAVYQGKIASETASIRTWQAERDKLAAEASERLADAAEVREALDNFADRFRTLHQYTTAQRRRLAQALHLRVAVYQTNHAPWIEMACDLPGIVATWHAVPLARLRQQGIEGEMAYFHLWVGGENPPRSMADERADPAHGFLTRSGKLLIPVLDTTTDGKPPQVSERVLRQATPSRTG